MIGFCVNEDYKYVAAIAEHGSISKAARAMHISQPGMSQRLRKLEAKLGISLFDRDSYPLRPTPSGEVFVDYALRAIASEERMRRDVVNVAAHKQQRLRMGISSLRACALLCVPIMQFCESHQDCTIEFCEMNTLEEMHDLFVRDQIDFAMLTPIAPEPELYDMQVLCREELVVVASPDLQVPSLKNLRSGKVFMRQLEGVPFVIPSCGSYYDPLVSRIVDSSDAPLEIIVRDCDARMALHLVERGIGACIVPSTLLVGNKHLRAFTLADVSVTVALRYVRKRGTKASEEEKLFLRLVSESVADNS